MSEHTALPVVVDCWNTIGVKGDRSCGKLTEAIHCHNCGVFGSAARTFLDRPAPEGYTREITELLAGSAGSHEARDRVSAVIFEVEDQLLAMDIQSVIEVTETRAVHRVGHRTGRVFAGLVNIHGQLELCASLRGLLQITPGRAGGSPAASVARMLLAEHGGRRWAFPVDCVHGVHRFVKSDVSSPPATSLQDGASFVRNVLRFGDRRAAYLDLDKTFNALENSLR